MIVDCHCHAGKGDGFAGPWDTEARIEPHLERARCAGIERTVVFPVFSSDYGVANARLARSVDAHPHEFIAFAAVHPVRDAGRIQAMVSRAGSAAPSNSTGSGGLKVHGRDAFPTRAVCTAACRYRLPIVVDVVRRLIVVEMLSASNPTGASSSPTWEGSRTTG